MVGARVKRGTTLPRMRSTIFPSRTPVLPLGLYRLLVHSLLVHSLLVLSAGCGNTKKIPPADPPARAKPASGEPSSRGANPEAQTASEALSASGTSAEVPPSETTQALLNRAAAREQSPAEYSVEFNTTKGSIIIDVHRAWAPRGADRFYNLVKLGYYDGVAFFRVVGGFVAQFGIHGTPEVNRAWKTDRIEDDPVRESNTRGRVTFATSGPNSRTTQVFLNLGNNQTLDRMGFAPFGEVRDMATADRLHSGYGDGPPSGRGPVQGRIQSEGNAYLKAEFPEIDFINTARVTDTQRKKRGQKSKASKTTSRKKESGQTKSGQTKSGQTKSGQTKSGK